MPSSLRSISRADVSTVYGPRTRDETISASRSAFALSSNPISAPNRSI